MECFDNHWVGHSVIKPVDAVDAQKIKATRQVNNSKINYFEMDITDEGALDKSLQVTGKSLDEKILKNIL